MIGKRAQMTSAGLSLKITCFGNLINRGEIKCDGTPSKPAGGDVELNVYGVLDNLGGYISCKGMRIFQRSMPMSWYEEPMVIFKKSGTLIINARHPDRCLLGMDWDPN